MSVPSVLASEDDDDDDEGFEAPKNVDVSGSDAVVVSIGTVVTFEL